MIRIVMAVVVAVGISQVSAFAANELPEPAKRVMDYERDVRPILNRSCASCHGPDQQRGGLRLDRKADALRGGDSGPVIVSKDSKSSLLIQLVAGQDSDRVMPPKGERLTATEIGILRAWIDQGASWPGDTTNDDPRNWWSLKPLHQPKLPTNPHTNPIDTFVQAKLREKGLSSSPPADRRTLIRRVYYDLIGLPPTPDEIQAFEDDSSANAYEKIVDRLLASPRYGERWARHWLDVVHYGDTHGYDKDQPRPNAWPYRDYVIRSLNTDKPYAQFVQEQIAGDVFFPGTIDGTTAMGFLSAGPWDLIGHAEVPETKIDGKIARHLDRDDMVANAMNTFVSMTVQCAQCHNHKFDPISQVEYYRMHAVFSALDRADRPYHNNAKDAEQYRKLLAEQAKLTAKRTELEAAVKRVAGPALAAIDAKIAEAGRPVTTRAEYGYHSAISSKQAEAKWVQIDLGKPIAISKIIVWPCHDNFNNIGAGFGFPVRFRVEACDNDSFDSDVHVIADHTTQDYMNPGISSVAMLSSIKTRYIRMTATKLAPRQNDFIFALSELEVLDADGVNIAHGKPVSALDSIEAPVRWRKSNLVDGYAPGKNVPGDVAKLRAERDELISKSTDGATASMLSDIAMSLSKIELELATIPPMGRVYTATIHTGTGSFRGTGPNGTPRPIHVLRRGDIRTPMQEVAPGAPAFFMNLPGEFALPASHTEGERRIALAKWLTDSRNPLTWRSIVNRMWQYHFGRGIVATPNDFGRMGDLPTHPELLDWLAADFRDNGQSLKKLHKLIVTSATYQQSSASRPELEKFDANNAYLWRMNRKKLEAEAIRDATLFVAGKLDLTMYGPAYRDFVIEHPAHSPHYEYHLHDPNDVKSYRRSIYRFLVRSKPSPFMTVLDCADPSMQVDKRTETLSPLQALALFNNGFMLVMAKHLAVRVEKEPDPVSTAFRTVLGRSPSASERDALSQHAISHGLPSLCRVILNLNEFVFVD